MAITEQSYPGQVKAKQTPHGTKTPQYTIFLCISTCLRLRGRLGPPVADRKAEQRHQRQTGGLARLVALVQGGGECGDVLARV
jgi:hypothetical protein